MSARARVNEHAGCIVQEIIRKLALQGIYIYSFVALMSSLLTHISSPLLYSSLHFCGTLFSLGNN